MIRRVRHLPPDRLVLGILQRITGPPTNPSSPGTIQGEFHAFSLRVKIREASAIKDDQIIHLIVKARDRRAEMGPDLLLIHHLIAGNFLRLERLRRRGYLVEARRTEGGA